MPLILILLAFFSLLVKKTTHQLKKHLLVLSGLGIIQKKHTNFFTFHSPKRAMVWDVMQRQSLLSGKMNLKQQFLKVLYVRIDFFKSFPMNYLKKMIVHTYLLQISY